MGELDYLLPLIARILDHNSKIRIKLIFLRPDVYKLYLDNEVLFILSKKLNIKIIYKGNSFLNNKLNLLKNLIFNLDNITKCFFDSNSLIMIENSGTSKLSNFFDIISKIFKKKLLLYPHTTALNHSKSISSVANNANKKLNDHDFIINHFMEYDYYKKIRKINGRAMYVTFPPENNLWKKLISSNFSNPINQDYIAIFLNGLRTKYFEPVDYEKILTNLLILCSNYLTSKKINILIKRHPRKYRDDEEVEILNKIKKKFSHLNLIIVNYSNYLLSFYSKYNFCLNSNSVFLANAMNMNTVFYFVNDENFKNCFPNGRSCMYFNIKNTCQEDDIIKIIKKL